MAAPGYPPVGAPREGNGLATAGMVLGILAIVLFFASLLDTIVAILAIIFSIIGLRKAKRVGGVGRGAAIAGLVTGIVGFFLSLAIIAVIAIPAFMDYMKKSKESEATLYLHRIERDAKTEFYSSGKFPVGSVPLTPATDCCGQPNNKCTWSPADTSNPVWQALEFGIYEPTSYRYSYESDGKTFVAKAVGDLDCDGVPATYEVHGSVDSGGNAQTELVRPPPGVY